MAVYSQFASGSFDGEAIIANESYVGAIGAYQMMEESSMNQHSIFEHVLGCDFVEAQAYHGYVSESTYEAINEASGEGIFSKVIAFFKKMAEKIKGIIENMINKVKAVFTKDGKKLVSKFKKTINTKMNNGVYNDSFKYKWNKFNEAKTPDKTADLGDTFFSTQAVINSKGSTKKMSISEVLKEAEVFVNDQNKVTTNWDKNDEDKKKKYKEALQTQYDAADQKDVHTFNTIKSDELNDYKDAALTAWLGDSTTVSDFAKDADEVFFPDGEEEEEGLTNQRLDSIIKYLEDENKTISALEKSKSLTEKKIRNDWIKKAETIQKDMNKLASRGNNNSFGIAGLNARAYASNVISMGNALTSCSTAIYAAWGAAFKKNYAQCRSVFIKAATYNKKEAKNEAAYLEAVGEVSDYEVNQMIPEF